MNPMYLVLSTSNKRAVGAFGFEGDHLQYDWLSEEARRIGDLSEEEIERVEQDLREARADEEFIKFFRYRHEDARVFERRKQARDAAARLNTNGGYDWLVVQVGDATPRDVRPVLRWKITCGDEDDRFESAHTDLRCGNDPLRTRKEARDVLAALDRWDHLAYRVEPVYGAWRVDLFCSVFGVWHPGDLRFRTKGAAESFGKDHYSADDYTVVLHDEEVPESELYAPL